MAGHDARHGSWTAMYRRQAVRLWSPLPPDECLYRFIGATGDPRRLGPSAPVPPLFGGILDERIAVSRWPESVGDGRHSYFAQLTGVIEAVPEGGTTLTGTVGVQTEVLAARLALLAVAGVVLVAACGLLATELIAVATGDYALVGHSVFPVFFVPVAIVPAIFLRNEIRGPGRYRQSVRALLDVIGSLMSAAPADTAPADQPPRTPAARP